MEKTCPYSPQQNGVAERKNRYLIEMIRSMFVDSSLPNKFWGEALMTANHLQNRMPAAEIRSPYLKNGKGRNLICILLDSLAPRHLL